eukprot:8081943-Lingulodinium_polyedra.AAC.1
MPPKYGMHVGIQPPAKAVWLPVPPGTSPSQVPIMGQAGQVTTDALAQLADVQRGAMRTGPRSLPTLERCAGGRSCQTWSWEANPMTGKTVLREGRQPSSKHQR